MVNTLFLQDRRFLNELDKLPIKLQYIKITVLNWQELPIQEVQGICISGSLNIDGKSSMRRTATLSIFAEEKENNLLNLDHLFAINKKCKLELGIKNTVPDYQFYTLLNNVSVLNTLYYKLMYGDIIWFPLGIFVMFNPSISHGLLGINISMNLKDKMCLLNGDLAGNIHSGVIFNLQDLLVSDYDGTSILKNPTLIYNIIKELVNHWGNLKLENIIISEVPFYVKSRVAWGGLKSVFLVRSASGSVVNIYTDSALIPQTPELNGSYVYLFKKNEDIGYTYTTFTYPGLLTCNPGDTVTSVLDKIISIMGNYLYFYDILGHFIFQLKKNNLNMTHTAYWLKENALNIGLRFISNSQGQDSGQSFQLPVYTDLPKLVYLVDLYRPTYQTYDFSYNEYETNFNNTLNYNNIKNDFVVWGGRSNGNSTVMCRYHLAIDKKPLIGQVHYISLYVDFMNVTRAKGADPQDVDGVRVISRTSTDWREEIYYQMLESEKLGTDLNTEINNSYFQYYAELKEEFPKIFDLGTGGTENNSTIAKGWTENTTYHPELINYYLDFIDDSSELGKYSVNNIGRRSKIVVANNNDINCVFEPYPPDIVYLDTSIDEYDDIRQMLIQYGQGYIQTSHLLAKNFIQGGTYNSCYLKIKDLLYENTNMNNTISITTLPIYYLQPNTRITINDGPAGIEGDYIISSISVPLDISGTMTIQAAKALEKI